MTENEYILKHDELSYKYLQVKALLTQIEAELAKLNLDAATAARTPKGPMGPEGA